MALRRAHTALRRRVEDLRANRLAHDRESLEGGELQPSRNDVVDRDEDSAYILKANR